MGRVLKIYYLQDNETALFLPPICIHKLRGSRRQQKKMGKNWTRSLCEWMRGNWRTLTLSMFIKWTVWEVGWRKVSRAVLIIVISGLLQDVIGISLNKCIGWDSTFLMKMGWPLFTMPALMATKNVWSSCCWQEQTQKHGNALLWYA